MVEWLRRAGLMRSESDADADIVVELFRASSHKFTCPACSQHGLATCEPVEDNDEAWDLSRNCEACGRPIPAERLEVFPDTRLCVSCQSGEEQGQSVGEVEYCPKCGTPMILTLARGAGIARYAMRCPACTGR